MTKKESILQAATLLFSQKGYKAAHVSEISKMTGVAEGTVFYHFKNKEELFLFILKRFKEDLIKELERYQLDNHFGTGLELLDGSLSFYLSLAGTMEERFLLLHRHDAYELAEVNSTCKKYLEDIYNCFVDIFENAILVGQRDRSIRDMPARKTALIIFSMVDGLVRFNTYNLYHAASLYTELIEACRRIVQNPKISKEISEDAD